MSNALNYKESQRSHQQNHHGIEPPAVLVDTWVWMMNHEQDPGLQAAGKDRLLDTFGDLRVADQYYRSHKMPR